MTVAIITGVVTVIIIEPGHFFNFLPPLGQILTGTGIFTDEKMSDFILVLCYKMSTVKKEGLWIREG